MDGIDKFSPRWNEGLAVFLQYLTANFLEDKPILVEKTNSFIIRIRDSEKYKKTALIDFGKEGLTGLSYIMGMVMFHVLYEVIGEKEFKDIIGAFYKRHYSGTASTSEFIDTIKELSSKNLDRFFNDWFYTTHYTKLIEQYASINELSNYYEK